MTQKEDCISSQTLCKLKGHIDDVINDDTASNVRSIDTDHQNTTGRGYCVISNKKLEISQDSTEHETTSHLPDQLEEIVTSPKEFFWHKPLLFLRRRPGLVLAIISPIFFSIQSLFVEILTDGLDSFQVVFMHVPVLLMCCLVLLIYSGVRPSREYRHYLWLLSSSTCQASNVCFLTLALKYLALGDTLTIVRTSVIQVGFFSWIILREPIRLLDLLFAILAFIGVIVIVRPPFIFGNYLNTPNYKVPLQGVLFAVAASSSVALLSVFNRKLSKLSINGLLCIFVNTAAAAFISGLVSSVLNRWRCPTLNECFFAMCAGVSYASAHFSYFYALKAENATLVTVLLTIQIPCAFLWQFLFIRLPPFWTSYIGAILIFAACVGISVKNKPPTSEPKSSECIDVEEYQAISTM